MPRGVTLWPAAGGPNAPNRAHRRVPPICAAGNFGELKKKRYWMILSIAAAAALVAAACRDDDAPAKGTNTAAAADAQAMPMQPGAEKMKVSITSPANGTKVTGNEVVLQVATSGFDMTCDLAGKPIQEGKGHYHVEIDKSLVNMYCAPEAKISLQNVKPGKHTFTVIPAQDDHAEVHENAASVEIEYAPTAALPEIKDATTVAKPTITIVSPKAGDTVSGKFDVVVEVKNFNLSCDLFGKPGVAGYGHWHLNLDSTSGPMMGMGTMAGMSCENVFHASTEGLQSGSTHTLIALLLDNGHAPLSPEVSSKVEVKVK
jgi:ribosomal protein L24E